jgi:meso-butanediol dehydrogenase/(S,S)-butanediol dehydrogenase/diacetyl reductase
VVPTVSPAIAGTLTRCGSLPPPWVDSESKVALITGGGGSIGAATARLFADEGAKVVLADVDEEGLALVTDEIGAERAAYVVTDVTDSEQVAAAVCIATDRFG